MFYFLLFIMLASTAVAVIITSTLLSVKKILHSLWHLWPKYNLKTINPVCVKNCSLRYELNIYIY